MSASVVDTWLLDQAEESGMEIDHLESWQHMIGLIDTDLSGKSVFDFGCNQGGFLRELYKNKPFANGFGVDVARKSIAVANSNKGSLPLNYAATADLNDIKETFDVAFSHEVLFLLPDLKKHAQDMRKHLNNGGVYYIVTGCYRENPYYAGWRKYLEEGSSLKTYDHGINEIVSAFSETGFTVQAKKFGLNRFMKVNENTTWYPSVLDQLNYYQNVITLFKVSLA